MVDKHTYLATKKKLKCTCRANGEELAKQMKLSDFETQLLFTIIDDKSSTQACMDLHISKNTYTKLLKILVAKLIQYKNTH